MIMIDSADPYNYDTDSRTQVFLDNSLWGEQTKNSLHFFRIGHHTFKAELILALVAIKSECAQVNLDYGLLEKHICTAIVDACDQILSGAHTNQFPLSIWQTGSGTQTNMNVNEVISSLANTLLNHANIKTYKVHPNDHVNLSQSTNDIFPTAMHVAIAKLTHDSLIPAISVLDKSLAQKQDSFCNIHMVGRTHLRDALPIKVGGFLSGFRFQIAEAKESIIHSLEKVYHLAIGGTAVGSGINAPELFGQKVSEKLNDRYKLPFQQSENLYAAVSGQDALMQYSSSLKQLASVLFKVANDFTLLSSGPRCGFNEWELPANEAGSSMMPGKVNATQCEALSMVCLQVFGNDLTISLAASHGALQLNVYRPVMIHNILESIELMTDTINSFSLHCVDGLALNMNKIESHMDNNLSIITVLTSHFGYDVSAKIYNSANKLNISLAQSAEDLGICSQKEFNAALLKSLKNNGAINA
jgi:fumarate hydratase class II